MPGRWLLRPIASGCAAMSWPLRGIPRGPSSPETRISDTPRVSESEAPLRIACFGLVQRDSGSVASANHRLLTSLVESGHHVEFFATAGYLPDPEVTGRGTFAFHPMVLREPAWWSQLGRLENRWLDQLRGLRWTYQAQGRVRALVNDPSRHFDVMLVLGTPPPTKMSLPVVSWPQGLPGEELAVLRQRRRLVTAISGWRAYALVRAFYELSRLVGSRRNRRTWTVVASEASRAQLVERGHPGSRVARIPYAVDLERFRPTTTVPGAARPKRILCLGRLDPRKRIDLLVEATALLAQRRQDFTVEIVGRPGYLDGWVELVEDASKRLPISYRQQIPQKEAADLLAQVDLLVQPSEAEEFGHAVAEALAAGTPVVIGPTNRTGEYVDEGKGSVFTAYTADAVAEAVEQWLDAPRGSAAPACRAAAERFFAPAVVAAAVEAFLHRAIAEHAGAP